MKVQNLTVKIIVPGAIEMAECLERIAEHSNGIAFELRLLEGINIEFGGNEKEVSDE